MNPDEKDFLYCKDIVTELENSHNIWTTVSIINWNNGDSPFIFSALIPNDEKSKKAILSSDDWGTTVIDMGKPHFYPEDDKTIIFNQGTVSIRGITVEPFTVYFEAEGKYAEHMELIQNFFQYHNLKKDQNGNYVDPKNSAIIVKITPEIRHIEVNTKYLRDYLAARNTILVRFFDHVRKSSTSVTEIQNEERVEQKINKENYTSSLVVTSNNFEKGTISIFHGIDIILPYDEPLHSEYLYFAGKEEEKKYADFIIGIDDKGKRIERRCDKEEGLKVCYFDRRVLKKYYDEPETYSIEDGLAGQIGGWGIAYGINRDRLVCVWLYKLRDLPYEEQLHWKTFNVEPSGGVSRSFWKRQMEAQFADSDDLVDRLKTGYKETNKKFESKFGFKLFLDLTGKDQYVLKTTHTLLTSEQQEFDQQVSYLSKLFVDCINKSGLEKNTKWKSNSEIENKSLNYLEHFLGENLQLEPNDLKEIMSGFRTIQTIRSKSSAHSKSSGYEEYVKELLQLQAFSIEKAHFEILKRLYHALGKIFVQLK